MMRALGTGLALGLAVAACGGGSEMAGWNAAPGAKTANTPAAKKEGAGPYDLDVALRPPASSASPEASGLVKFRQAKDASKLVQLETSVRGLGAKSSYQLQRAVDTKLDGVCTSHEWLTLGADNATPRALETDERGGASAMLTRTLPPTANSGDGFDVHFRVIVANSSPEVVVLESDCHRYVVR